MGRGDYKLKPLYQNDFYYSKPIPINQIENPVRSKYYDMRKNKFQPNQMERYKRKEYPMTKNVKSFKHTFPVKPFKAPYKSSPVLSNYHRGHKAKPPSFIPYMKDFNRRKPFRRKESFPPRRYYQKGFQKQFWLGREGWKLTLKVFKRHIKIFVDTFYQPVNKIRLKFSVFWFSDWQLIVTYIHM